MIIELIVPLMSYLQEEVNFSSNFLSNKDK